ncbi:MAG: DUF4240 domain-containing protein [Planctomycetes bacterium]|nr:DUF4240 domain-containing protein [Planctomycetota bacterium]
MTEEQFWKLIEESRRGATTDVDAQGEQLLTVLSKLNDDDLIEYDRRLTELQFKAYSWDLWLAAMLLNAR